MELTKPPFSAQKFRLHNENQRSNGLKYFCSLVATNLTCLLPKGWFTPSLMEISTQIRPLLCVVGPNTV